MLAAMNASQQLNQNMEPGSDQIAKNYRNFLRVRCLRLTEIRALSGVPGAATAGPAEAALLKEFLLSLSATFSSRR